LTNYSPIPHPTITWNICGSNYAAWPQTRAPRLKFRKEKTLSHEIANKPFAVNVDPKLAEYFQSSGAATGLPKMRVIHLKFGPLSVG
jgi:hypothetical protein